MGISGTLLHSNSIFVCFLIIATFGAPTTTAFTFNLPHIGPHHNKDILTEGDGIYISTKGIQLASPSSIKTSPEAFQSQVRVGRATYTKLLHLWDRASGQLADFTTNFSFVLDSDGGTDYGDGISFFLAQNSSLMAPAAASSPFVAVEFDTYWNPNWDPVDGRGRPIGDHVGININSLVSVKAKKWRNLSYGKECVVKIQYESASQHLSVTFTGQENTILHNQFELHYTVDLRSVLPEWVLFGFSTSSSRDHFQTISVKSWCFNSTDLHVDQKRWGKNKKRRVKEIAVGLVCAPVIGLLLAFFSKFVRKNNRPRDGRDQSADQGSIGTFEQCSPRPFSFEQLSQATDNFADDRKLGEGGFGGVYRAVLSDGTSAAVKRVSNTSQQGMKEYEAEVMIISKSSHKHLVQLIGWCHERERELLVVYELLENRSLDIHLFKSVIEPLAWDVRYKIAQGLAKALRYLHEECAKHWVLHRDVKSSNVLLDSNFDAKLSDFGLARHFEHDKSAAISGLAGTPGYLAPECVNGHFCPKSDVYSYGVVALEIATGRKSFDQSAPVGRQVLVEWVRDLYGKHGILEAADPRLGRGYNERQMKGLLVLGLWCVDKDFRKRPSIREIVRALNNTKDPLLHIHQKIRKSLDHDSGTRSIRSIVGNKLNLKFNVRVSNKKSLI